MRSLQAVAAAAPADEHISWRARGVIGVGVGDSQLRTTRRAFGTGCGGVD